MNSDDGLHPVRIIWPDSDQWPAAMEVTTAWIADSVINEAVVERLEIRREGESA